MEKTALIAAGAVSTNHKYGAVVMAGKAAVYNEDRTEIVGERDALQFVSDELVCTFKGEPRAGSFGLSARLSFKRPEEISNMAALPLTVWVNEANLGLVEAVKIGGVYNIVGSFTPKGTRASGEVRAESVSLRQVYLG